MMLPGRWLLAAVFLASLSACGVKPAITNRVTLDFTGDPHRVRVNCVSDLTREPAGNAMIERLAAAREAIAGARDEWSLRYANVHPDEERTTIERHNGQITRVERSATIDRDELPRFFEDASVTITLTRSNGVSELTVIPATSSRATRQQREHVMATLQSWSADVASYIEALSQLYAYLDAHPDRPEAVFGMLFGDHGERSTIREEQSLLQAVWDASDRITARLDNKDDPYSVDEEFDLTFNPFPAEITVHVPHPALNVENFFKQSEDTLVIRRGGLFDAVQTLEGKWITPDPLAAMLREKEPTAEQFAKEPRHFVPVVTATEIEKAVVDRLKPAPVYRVTWNE